MEVAGEDEVEGARRQPVDHAGVVAKEDAEVRLRVDELLRAGDAVPVAARVDACDLHLHAAEVDRARVVGEERRRPELGER